MTLLRIDNMTHFFGGLQALTDYHLDIEPGQVKGLIGPNGAGKTTVFNLVTGIHRPTEGTILLEGNDIVGLQPHEIASRGLGRTFQELRLWRHMTVLEHVIMAHYAKIDYGLIGAFFGSRKRRQREKEFEVNARRLLGLMGIEHLANQLVTHLPYGVQRRVEIARALAIGPKLLFLDEPTAGMNPEELSQMVAVIRRIREELGLAIFLIEHRLRVVMELCQMIQALVFGRVIAEGTPGEIKNDPRVIEAYLGEETVT